MPKWTIDLNDEAYERLQAEKREDESFSDTINRITEEAGEETSSDWREGLGKYSGEEAEAFEEAVRNSSTF